MKEGVVLMKPNPIVREAISQFKENELIIACNLYKNELSDKISEAAYYKTLGRMCMAGELVKIAKGTYHLPKLGKYGIVPPSENDVISAFTQNGTGTVIGYSLYNSLNLTTQISQRIVVVSSALAGFTKTIRNVTVYQLPLDYSEPVINMVNGLEVLQNFSNIQDINLSAFLVYTEKIAKTYDAISIQEILATGRYKKSTIAFLREVLNFYHRENNLDIYLSTLSDYKHPKMTDISIAAKQ